MPTDALNPKPTSVFLLAHQDDEFGVFHTIESHKRLGRRIICAYLTSGAVPGGDPTRRNAESREVLAELGVDEVIFAGAQIGVADGHLHERLPAVGQWLTRFFETTQALQAIMVPAWEGGHPDHDCLHAATVESANSVGKGDSIRQFPLYNGSACPGPFFKVLAPLSSNGSIESERIPVRNRLRYLRLLLRYRSQLKTWTGLMPFVLLHYFVKGTQDLQRVDAGRVRERPHTGRLYYEKRGFAQWEEVDAAICALRGSSKGLAAPMPERAHAAQSATAG